MTRKLAIAVLAALMLAGTARAEGLDVIAVRQAGQDLLLGDFTGITAVVKAHGDVTKLEKPALAMARWMRVYPTLFPPGSDKGDNTKARPAIWSNMPEFRKDANNLVLAAEKLAALAKAGDAAAMPAQLKVVGEACGTCHHSFREQ